MQHRAEIRAIEQALRNAESEMSDLIGVLNDEYEAQPADAPHEGAGIGFYKIYEVNYWMRQVRLGVRALKKEIKKHATKGGLIGGRVG